MSRKKRHFTLEQVEITDIGAEGKAIGKYNDMVVFIPGGIPGDIMDVQVKKKRKNYMEGKPLQFHRLSDMRVEPFCRHFGTCGGCKWQHLGYENQLYYKQKQVIEQFKHIGQINLPAVNSILPSPKTQYYRNKMDFTFTNRRWLTEEEINTHETIENRNALGFHVAGRFDKVLHLEECYLQPPPSNKIRLDLASFAQEHHLPFFDIIKQTGFLRNLIIRTASTNEVMVIVAFFYEDRENIEKVMNYLASRFPEITSLMYVINPKGNDSIADLDIQLYKGNDHLYEKMDTISYKIGPKSFFQTNSDQAARLYKKIAELGDFQGHEMVYDLYTGIGSIALYIAPLVQNVIGLESIQEAVTNAEENARINDITNASFFAGDMKDLLSYQFIKSMGAPDVIILDPPRPGIHKDVTENILYAAPDKIIYVSCNPATQARDIHLLSSHYKTEIVQPLDMFPHTHHVENLVLLTKK